MWLVGTLIIPQDMASALIWHSPALHSWATRFRTSTAAGHCCMNSSQNRLSSKSCAMTRHALNVKRCKTFQSHQCSFFKISTVKHFNQFCHFYILFFQSRLAWKYIVGTPYSWGSGPMDLTIQTKNKWKKLPLKKCVWTFFSGHHPWTTPTSTTILPQRWHCTESPRNPETSYSTWRTYGSHACIFSPIIHEGVRSHRFGIWGWLCNQFPQNTTKRLSKKPLSQSLLWCSFH